MKFELNQLLALAAVSTTAVASPQKRDVTSAVLNQLDLYAQWSAASYCGDNLNGTNTAVACSAGNCPDVQAADTKILYGFDNVNGYGDAAGYLAADNTNKRIVLAFRGSRTLSNWLSNLQTTMMDCPLCTGCQCHTGFWNDYQTVAATLQSQIDSAKQTYPGYALFVTGHSLGGALAMLSGTDLQNKGYAPTIYTYGQPRVGNLALATYITNTDTQWRTTHTDDKIPNVPPTTAGFSHSSPEYWITSPNNVTVTTTDIQVIQGIDSTQGNAGTLNPTTTAHSWYFINMSLCS